MSTTNHILEHSHAYFGHLPEHILFDLARNESADRRMRVAAVEIMVEKGYAKASHPELALLLAEIKTRQEAKEEVAELVETAVEKSIEEWPSGPFAASVTTANMMVEYTPELPPVASVTTESEPGTATLNLHAERPTA